VKGEHGQQIKEKDWNKIEEKKRVPASVKSCWERGKREATEVRSQGISVRSSGESEDGRGMNGTGGPTVLCQSHGQWPWPEGLRIKNRPDEYSRESNKKRRYGGTIIGPAGEEFHPGGWTTF